MELNRHALNEADLNGDVAAGGPQILLASVTFTCAAQFTANANLIAVASVATAGVGQLDISAAVVRTAAVQFTCVANFSASPVLVLPSGMAAEGVGQFAADAVRVLAASVTFTAAASFQANAVVIGQTHLASVAFTAQAQFNAAISDVLEHQEPPGGGSSGGVVWPGLRKPEQQPAGQIIYASVRFEFEGAAFAARPVIIHAAAVVFTARMRMWIDVPLIINDDADILDIITLLAAA